MRFQAAAAAGTAGVPSAGAREGSLMEIFWPSLRLRSSLGWLAASCSNVPFRIFSSRSLSLILLIVSGSVDQGRPRRSHDKAVVSGSGSETKKIQ